MQVDALVILWGRLTDRGAMGAVLPTLHQQQLDALLARLGHYHVLSLVDPPFGCQLRFEIIGNPEQEAAAKLLCKSAAESQQVLSLVCWLSAPHTAPIAACPPLLYKTCAWPVLLAYELCVWVLGAALQASEVECALSPGQTVQLLSTHKHA